MSRKSPRFARRELCLGVLTIMKKSLRIKGLDPNAAYGDMARIILRDRLRRVHRIARQFQKHQDPAELSSLRSAIYRLRYPLECFVDTLPRRVFNAVLDEIELLQRALEQLNHAEAMLDNLRTRQMGSHGESSAFATDDDIEDEDTTTASNGSAKVAVVTVLDEGLESLESDRARRLEAFEGALKAVLDSEALRQFRQVVRGEA